MTQRVRFTDDLASEVEFFEEYNKYNQFNFWFVLIYILRTFVPFCLALQTDFVNHPSIIDRIQRFVQNHSNYNTTFIYETSCFKRKVFEGMNSSILEYCERQRILIDINICKKIGATIAAIIAGPLADIYGRRMTSLICAVCWGIFSWICVLMPTLITIKVCFVVISAFCSSVDLVTFINFAEIANKKNRVISIYSIQGYVLGKVLLGFILPRLAKWTLVSIFIAANTFIMIFSCWYIPESVRWLWNKNKQTQAFSQLENISGLRYLHAMRNFEETETEKGKVFVQMFVFLVRQKLGFFLLICHLSTISGFVYFCSKWNLVTTYIHTKQYEHLASLAEVASFIFLIPLYMFVGKRCALCFIYVLLAVQCLAGIIQPVENTDVYVHAFGTLLGVTAWCFVSLYILEMFPTFLRATVTGFAWCLSAIASIFAVILVDLLIDFSTVHYHITLLMMAVLGGLAYYLPTSTKKDLSNQRLFP